MSRCTTSIREPRSGKMRRTKPQIWVSVLCYLLPVLVLPGLSCRKTASSTQVVQKGDRHLGIHLSTAADGDYAAAFNKARTAGVDCIPMTLQWSALENTAGYDSAGLLTDLNGFYGTQPVTVSVCLSPFAADRRDMPADLSTKSFDDPAMIDRFNNLLDTIHRRLDKVTMRYLLLGNECDLYLAEHASEWPAYGRFCRAVRLHARALWGENLGVGAETTLGATMGSQAAMIRTLQDSMDLLCLTYYPLTADFHMQPGSQVATDFSELFSSYPDRPLLFQELGYATGSACGGTDSAQANFIHSVFSAWDAHAGQVVFAAFLWLNDLSPEQADAVTVDYGLTGTPVAPAFTEYIRTLGLCSNEGEPKPGFVALQQEALARGWGR